MDIETVPVLAVLLVVGLSGCLGSGIVGSDTTVSESQTVMEPEECGDGKLSVMFAEPVVVNNSTVKFNHEIPPQADILFVLYVDGEPVNSKYQYTSSRAVASDFVSIDIDDSFSGEHELQIRAFGDVNGDEVFTPADEPCTYNGAPADTRTVTMNLSDNTSSK